MFEKRGLPKYSDTVPEVGSAAGIRKNAPVRRHRLPASDDQGRLTADSTESG